MSKKDRENDAFNLSFLDVITCGFGAIILLLMIARPGDITVLETSDLSLSGVVRELQTQLFEIRGETKILNRDLNAKHEQISVWDEKVARLRSELKYTKTRYEDVTEDSSVEAIITGELELALQSLTEEMQRLLGDSFSRENNTVGGIPVDSEYIIFVIDTSGSMYDSSWNKMLEIIGDTLDVYPDVKGIQVMNDMGEYMFTQYTGKWIPDTPARRSAIIKRLKRWQAFSNSSPVEGINAAINTFYSKNKKISLYVFGDEFTGPSIQSVLREVRRLNPKNKKGNRRVRIHAVGFPIQFSRPNNEQATGVRFATLMRALCEQNGGTFVGLNTHFR